jgi:hypothetical protein
MIDAYREEADSPLYLSGKLQTPPRNFHTTEKVEMDIVRDDPDVAVVIQDLTAKGRENEQTRYTNKAFTPPIFKEIGTITSYDFIKRRAGNIDFLDPNFMADAVEEAFIVARKLERKIRRSIEWMSSQMFQLAALTLIDDAGVALYTLDFLAKATHKVTVGTVWAVDGSTGTPLADLEALARVVRRDGKKNPGELNFGASAWQRFMANADVKQRVFNNYNSPNYAQVNPQPRGEGATFMGWVWIGQYKFECWLYDGYFKHPQTGVLTPFIGDDNVIMTSPGARYDLSFGAIPAIRPPLPEVAAFLPSRMPMGDIGMDLNLLAYFSENGEHLKIQVGARPLTIPTAIDTFACLDVTP